MAPGYLIEGKVGEGSGARPPLPPDPDANLTASVAVVAPGGPVTLTWSTRGAAALSRAQEDQAVGK